MEKDFEYHLDDPGEIKEIEKALPKNKKLMIALISIAIIQFLIIVIGIILYFTLGKKKILKKKIQIKNKIFLRFLYILIYQQVKII